MCDVFQKWKPPLGCSPAFHTCASSTTARASWGCQVRQFCDKKTNNQTNKNKKRDSEIEQLVFLNCFWGQLVNKHILQTFMENSPTGLISKISQSFFFPICLQSCQLDNLSMYPYTKIWICDDIF